MPLLQFFTRRGCDMYKFVVAISGLTFVLECWKFIWQVELDKRNKSKKPPTTGTRRRLNITLKLSFRRQTVCNGSLCFLYYNILVPTKQAFVYFFRYKKRTFPCASLFIFYFFFFSHFRGYPFSVTSCVSYVSENLTSSSFWYPSGLIQFQEPQVCQIR